LAGVMLVEASASVLESTREHARRILAELDAATAASDGESVTGWIDGAQHRILADEGLDATGRRRAFFDRHGFVVVRGFAGVAECEQMIAEMTKLATERWNPERAAVFRTDSEQADTTTDYFLRSAEGVGFFAETKAVDENGALLDSVTKVEALNKAGHGLHNEPGVFFDYSRSERVARLVRGLGWEAPVLPQSMYIFKQAGIGGEVTSHQDSTFLHTTPRETCLGLWLALHPATLTNGCLWVRPGSHREPVRRLFERNPAYFAAGGDNAGAARAPNPMLFRALGDDAAVSWEGGVPGDGSLGALLAAGFVPVEVGRGDLVVFPGTLDHLSLANTSDSARHTFQLHLIEGPEAGVTWSSANWLQYPDGKPFPRL